MKEAESAVRGSVTRERTALGLVVICAGGFMDAYSYLTRGHVFATGQTGNIVLLGIHLAQLEWMGVARYLAPIIAFVIGVLVSKHVLASVHAGDHFRMQRWVIAFEAAAFAAIALLPETVPDLLVNVAISFCAAVSFENFRTFGTKSAYASVFCTGNLRSFAETLYGASIVAYGAFVGAGDTLVPSIMNFMSMWVVRIGLALWLTPICGLVGYWIAMCIELNFRGIIFLIRLKGKRWLSKSFAINVNLQQ